MNVSHICRSLFTIPTQVFEKTGGPGGTRTPNQTVMSAGQWQQALSNLLLSLKSAKIDDCKKRLKVSQSVASFDAVNHPRHYTNHPSGVECIAITEHMNFCLGNAIKYIWRAGLKQDAVEDLEKAVWYVNREIERRRK